MSYEAYLDILELLIVYTVPKCGGDMLPEAASFDHVDQPRTCKMSWCFLQSVDHKHHGAGLDGSEETRLVIVQALEAMSAVFAVLHNGEYTQLLMILKRFSSPCIPVGSPVGAKCRD